MKHHPDADPSEEASKDFSRICEAYEVLSNGEQHQRERNRHAGKACTPIAY